MSLHNLYKEQPTKVIFTTCYIYFGSNKFNHNKYLCVKVKLVITNLCRK